MYINTDLSCCGTREIDGLSSYDNPEEAMKALFDGTKGYDTFYDDQSFRFVYFTEAIPSGKRINSVNYGKQFAAYIEKENLGKVTAIPHEVNPNTGNKVGVFVWVVDWNGVHKWFRDHTVQGKHNSRDPYSCDCLCCTGEIQWK